MRLAVVFLLVYLLQGCISSREGASVYVTRGPYIQLVNETGATLRWRTNQLSTSKVSWGTSADNLVQSSTQAALTTEHEIRINGLTPDTRYVYTIGTMEDVLEAADNQYFTTAPPATTTRKIRVATFGDCGQNYRGYQTRTLKAYQQYVGQQQAELLLLLGDNAYRTGTDAEYQRRFFNVYGRPILRNHTLYPATGNHDYYAATQVSRTHAYYQNFTLPTKGEIGGVPSGTEAYYSYNWGNIHFICLDSYGLEDAGTTRLYDTAGSQVQWLKKDLEANRQLWTIAYWHHPPYTMGSHNSDTEEELIRIRTQLLPLLERYGVDLVINGHSHNYERSYFMRGYYGDEASFNVKAHALDAGSGSYNGLKEDCPYIQTSQKSGIVYVVAGSSGAGGKVQAGYPHNAMPYAIHDGGMFYFEVEANRLDAKFIQKNGKIADQFTMMKRVQETTNIHMQRGTAVSLSASWIGKYHWSTGDTTRSITVKPAANTSYVVADGRQCLKDSFYVVVRQ